MDRLMEEPSLLANDLPEDTRCRVKDLSFLRLVRREVCRRIWGSLWISMLACLLAF